MCLASSRSNKCFDGQTSLSRCVIQESRHKHHKMSCRIPSTENKLKICAVFKVRKLPRNCDFQTNTQKFVLKLSETSSILNKVVDI